MTTTANSTTDCATAWFAILERARLAGDYELAAKAAAELRRLGVEVKFGKPNREGVSK